ncbi:MAG TPA: glycoside hydrolase family 9 protein, partial [Actinomycetota bacterium]|nr:glycoside hydrolase family 9 protein [Actinomycetota bacterium]
MTSIRVNTLSAVVVALTVIGSLTSMPGRAVAHTSVHIRVNQVGYVVGAPKRAFLMSETDLTGRPFNVLDAAGASVFEADIAESTGAWSSVWRKTHLADFSAFDQPGTYRIAFDGDTFSPTFRIGSARELYQEPLADAVWFFGAQRDGPDVDSAKLNRQPSHLADAEAFVYRTPRFRGGQVTRPLRKVGGPVDVSGGWLDAGDYLKFLSQSSFVEILMLLGLRDHQASFQAPSDLDAEARFGLDWLDKMWEGDTRTLYIQVGIAHVNDRLLGDHDLWRLPQRDDRLDVQPGDRKYFVKYRPVFRAGAPDAPLSPNLAGRVAAAFALCAQVYRVSDPARADACL